VGRSAVQMTMSTRQFITHHRTHRTFTEYKHPDTSDFRVVIALYKYYYYKRYYYYYIIITIIFFRFWLFAG